MAENREGRKFCAECGTPLNARCASCGAENDPAEKFCGECGVALGGKVRATSAKAPATKLTAPKVHVTPEQPDVSEIPDGERKTVTALFADIKGSTELEQDLDPEDARALVDPVLQLMIDAVRRYNGYIVQSTGDGISLCSARPWPMRTIRSARSTQRSRCRRSCIAVDRLCNASAASVDRAVGLLRDVRGDSMLTQCAHQLLLIVTLVGAQRDSDAGLRSLPPLPKPPWARRCRWLESGE